MINELTAQVMHFNNKSFYFCPHLGGNFYHNHKHVQNQKTCSEVHSDYFSCEWKQTNMFRGTFTLLSIQTETCLCHLTINKQMLVWIWVCIKFLNNPHTHFLCNLHYLTFIYFSKSYTGNFLLAFQMNWHKSRAKNTWSLWTMYLYPVIRQ